MRATIIFALVLAITVQSAYSHLGLNVGLNTQKSIGIGGIFNGILGKVGVEKSLSVNVGNENGINIQRKGMVSLGGGKWGFEKSGSISIGGGNGGISTTGQSGGSINILEGHNGYVQGQQSIHNEGHFHQNAGYDTGAQGSLTQNTGHYEQHSSLQNTHLGSSNIHFEQKGFQQSSSGQITGHAGHVESSNVHFGQQGIEQSGHGQIGDIFLGKTENVHISGTGQSKIHVQQKGIEESNLDQITGHSGHQNIHFGQPESEESNYAHGKVEGSKQVGDIIVVIKDQNNGKVHKSNDRDSNIHFEQAGVESNYDHIIIDGSKQNDIIVVIKDKNSGKVHGSHDESTNIHFKEGGVEQTGSRHVSGSSEHKTNDQKLIITGQGSETVHNSQGNIKSDWGQVTGHSEDKTNDYDFKLNGQDGENVRNILSQNSKVNSEHGSVRGQAQIQGQSQLNQNQIQTQFGERQVQKQSQSGHIQGHVQTQSQTGHMQGHIQSQSQFGEGQVQIQSQFGHNQGQVQTQSQFGEGQVQLQSQFGHNQGHAQTQSQFGEGQVQIQSQSGDNQVQSQGQFGEGQVQIQSQSGDNQVQSQGQFGKGKVSEGSGINGIFGFHKAGEILFGFEKPIGHDGHNKIEHNFNGHINGNRGNSEEGSINVESSVTDAEKNSLIVANEDEHTSNIKVDVDNQNLAKESFSGESSLSLNHGNGHSSIVGVGHHANGHDSTGQVEVTKEVLNLGEKSHHSESSASNSRIKQGLWNLDFGYNKKVEKQSKVEVSHHEESSSSLNHSHSSVQKHSQSSHSSSSHMSSSHVESSRSSSKFHHDISSSNIAKLEHSNNFGDAIDIRVQP